MLISRLAGWGAARAHTYDTPPTLVGVSSSMAAGAVSISVGVANNYQAGDLLMLFLCGNNATPATPDGWTSLDVYERGGARYRVCYKWAEGSESAVGVADSGNYTVGLMAAFRGVDTSNPFNVTGNGADSGTSFSTTGITTTVANCLYVVSLGFTDTGATDSSNYTSWANASLASITEGWDGHSNGGSSYQYGGIAFAYGVKTTAGSTGTTTATADSSVNLSSIIKFALTPAA